MLHTRTDDRRLRGKKRHRLSLHVGSHQRSGRVIILQERNEGRSNREHLPWGNIHVIKHALLILLGLVLESSGNHTVKEMPFLIKRLGSLSHMVVIFLIRRHVYYFIHDPRVFRIGMIHLSVRRLNKSVFVYPCIACKGVDQSDVGSFGSLYGTHASVVRIMDIPDLHARTVS